MTREQAERVVDAFIEDLDGRALLGRQWSEIAEAKRCEIREAWIGIILAGGEPKKPVATFDWDLSFTGSI